MTAEDIIDSSLRSVEVLWHLASTGERKLQKEGCERRAQIGEGRPGLGQAPDCPRMLQPPFWIDWSIFQQLKDCT
jgi:hypothetical protein